MLYSMISLWSMWGIEKSFTTPLGKEDWYPWSCQGACRTPQLWFLSRQFNTSRGEGGESALALLTGCSGAKIALSSAFLIPMSHGERSGELRPSLYLPWQREAVGKRTSALLHPACQPQPVHRNTKAGKSEIPGLKDKQLPQ